MASTEYGIDVETRGNIVDAVRMEMEFKKDKARTKSNFTRSRNKLLLLVDEQDMPSRRGVRVAWQNMDNCMEMAMEVLTKFTDFYIENQEFQKGKMVISEMEKIEADYYKTAEAAQEYLESRKDDASSVSSDIRSIDLCQRITDDRSEAFPKEAIVQQRTLAEVKSANIHSLPMTIENEQSCRRPMLKETGVIDASMYEHTLNENVCVDAGSDRLSDIAQGRLYHSEQHIRNTDGSGASMNAHAAPFAPRAHAAVSEPTMSCDIPSLGQDLWRQLKRVQIPVFSGVKRTYQSWKAAFLACIDSAPATEEYKLLQLRQYLTGEALKTIENLGHSAFAYEAAKERLERKYGGKRRQIALYIEELEQFRPIRLGNARDLEQFADLLDISVINLKEAGKQYELGDGSLYRKLQRKLPESMLAQYNRWIFENSLSESVLTLRTWVIQESEFQTVASETVHGVAGMMMDTQPIEAVPKYKNSRTFFGDTTDDRSIQQLSCRICGAPHGIWKCQEFIQKSVSDRWNVAKLLHLCFRCLAEGHPGKSCPRSNQCGQNGCQESHHRLLHSREVRQSRGMESKSSVLDTCGSNEFNVSENPSDERVTFRHGGE